MWSKPDLSVHCFFFLETSLFFSLGSKYASAGSVLQCKLTPMPKSHFVQKSSHVVFSRNIFLIFLDALKQGSKTSLKLRATSKALSKTKNYLFDTDFPNNVITISSGTYSSRHSFYYCPYTRLQCNWLKMGGGYQEPLGTMLVTTALKHPYNIDG